MRLKIFACLLIIFVSCAGPASKEGIVDQLIKTEATGKTHKIKRVQQIDIFPSDHFDYRYELYEGFKRTAFNFKLPINTIEDVNTYNLVLDNKPYTIVPTKPFKFNLQNQLNTVFKYKIYRDEEEEPAQLIYFSQYYGMLYQYNYADQSTIELVECGMSDQSDVTPLIDYIKSDLRKRELEK